MRVVFIGGPFDGKAMPITSQDLDRLDRPNGQMRIAVDGVANRYLSTQRRDRAGDLILEWQGSQETAGASLN